MLYQFKIYKLKLVGGRSIQPDARRSAKNKLTNNRNNNKSNKRFESFLNQLPKLFFKHLFLEIPFFLLICFFTKSKFYKRAIFNTTSRYVSNTYYYKYIDGHHVIKEVLEHLVCQQCDDQ